MTLISHQELEDYRNACTRTIDVGESRTETVRLPLKLWDYLPLIELGDGYGTPELAELAREEMRLQGFTFEEAFRCVVNYLANQYYDRYGQAVTRHLPDVGSVTMAHLDWMHYDCVIETEIAQVAELIDTAKARVRTTRYETFGDCLREVVVEILFPVNPADEQTA